MQRCRFHVDEICTTCRFHEDKICTLAYFMRITTFYILFIFLSPPSTFYSTYSLHPKRPLPTHSTQASGLLIFPYFFKLLQATQLLFFYAAFTAHTLSLIVLIAASPAAFYFSTLHLSACSFPYYLSL